MSALIHLSHLSVSPYELFSKKKCCSAVRGGKRLLRQALEPQHFGQHFAISNCCTALRAVGCGETQQCNSTSKCCRPPVTALSEASASTLESRVLATRMVLFPDFVHVRFGDRHAF